MSLGKIGKLTNVFNAFKQSPFSNKSDMISSLAAFGNINKAASYLNKVNSDGAISNTASKMLLYKAYAASGITKEEAGEALNNNLAGSSKFGLLGNIKNVGSGIAAVFKSIAPMMIPLIIGAAGIKAGKMLWDNVLTDNAAQKNLQESVQKYKTEKSDLDNLQSQKETNKQRVYELRAKSNRTAAEDNELNNLLNEDSILDAQIGLKKRTVTSAQKQQALDAKKALEKRTFQGELFGKSPYPVYQDTNIGYAQKLMSGLEDEKQARKDVLNNKEWSSERKEAELKAKDKTIVSYETELADVMSDISSNAQDLYDEDGNLIDKKNTQDLANNINDLFKASFDVTVGSSTMYPDGDGSYSCGSSGHRWKYVYASNGINTGSDEYIKENIKSITNFPSIDKFYMSLNPIQYKFKQRPNDDEISKIHFGFGARETERHLKENNFESENYSIVTKSILDKPNFVGRTDEYSMNYLEFISLNTHMTQKAHHRIDSLESENQSLKNEILMLQGQLSLITQRLQKMEEKLC